MTLFVYTYVLLWIISGIFTIIVCTYNSITNRNVSSVTYHQISENDMEYIIRCSLFRYPYAEIYVPVTEISTMFAGLTNRVMTIDVLPRM